MDINMPVMNGIEATRQIQQIYEEKKATLEIYATTA